MGPIEHGLWSACVTLAGDRPLTQVKVADICRHACVHRSTFYRHFEDRADLVQRGTARLVVQLALGVEAPASTLTAVLAGGPPSHLLHLFEAALVRRRQLEVVLDPDRGFAFRSALTDALTDLGVQRLALLRPVAGPQEQLVARFCAGGLVESLAWWVARGCSPSPEQMAADMADFIARGATVPLGLAPELASGRES